MVTVKKTLAQIRREGGGTVDRRRVRAMSDADIDRQIAADPDVAPDVSRLGAPLPDVKAIRAHLRMTQATFARRLGIPVATVRNWEQRRTVPDPAAVALLTIIERMPAALRALPPRRAA